MNFTVVILDRYYNDDLFCTANINAYSIYLYITVFIDIGQSSLDVHAIACVFTYEIASVFIYIMHYCIIIIILHKCSLIRKVIIYITIYLPIFIIFFLPVVQTRVKALLHPRTFPFVSGIALYDCCLLLVTGYYIIHNYSDCNLFINVLWFGESIVIPRCISMLYQMMIVKPFILLQPLIACSRITFSKPSYNLMSILDSCIIKVVLARYAIYDIDSRIITILCVFFYLTALNHASYFSLSIMGNTRLATFVYLLC